MKSKNIAKKSALKRFEWPTLALIVVCTCAFPALTFWADALTLWFAVPVLAVLIALHSSIQHEVLHGHPFKSRHLNEALVSVPVGIFVPYRRFRDLHIRHHLDENLTDPYDDPETNFHDPEIWHKTGWFMRRIWLFNNTLFGRMLIGPMVGMIVFYHEDAQRILSRNFSVIFAYVLHMLGLVVLFWWLVGVASMPVWAYLLSAYAAMSLLKIRTFLEHRAHDIIGQRTAIVEDRGFFGFLFLNNNFHAVHHALPKLPWYQIPKNYDTEREKYDGDNGNYAYKNYREIFKLYLFRAKDQVPHPIWSSRNRSK